MSTSRPRIFVGTLYYVEGEYDACCAAIDSQVDVKTDHITVSFLPEMIAHNKLWAAWNSVKDSHDLFVKVDADTILKNDHVFIDAYEEIKKKNATGMQAPLHDHLTNTQIMGLNIFTPEVIFLEMQNDLYCDRADVNNTRSLRNDEVPASLRPAGSHCSNPTDVQAFHFGLHRALKNQVGILNAVKSALKIEYTTARALVLLGAEASKEFFYDRRFNYSDDKLNEVMYQYLDSPLAKSLGLIC